MIAQQPLRIGQKISLTKTDVDEDHAHTKVKVTYLIKEVYPHHVVIENEKGIRRSITNAELMTLGYVTQRR